MIRKIVLENYMAHIRTVIEPAQGLTVLIGPNNCGKSAIIHALEMICYNSDAADYAIRHGAKKAVVTIETQDEDGSIHTVAWWRTAKSAGYIIDGREISGMGKGKIPDDLHEHLRMPMIESGAGGKEFLLHFGLQKSPIFLLDDPASRAAQFFASATDADKLMQMQKAHQQKAINAKRDKEKLDSEVEQLDRQLEALSPLPILSKGLNDLEDDHRKLNELATAIGSIGQSVQAMERVEKHVAVNGLQIKSLASLQNPPTLADTQKLTEWIRQTERSISDAALSHARGETLRELHKSPDLPTTEPLQRICNDIAEASSRITLERGRADALEPLAAPPKPHDVPSIRKTIGDIARSEEQHAQWNGRITALASIAVPPVLADTSQLMNSINDLEQSSANAHRHQFKCDALKLLSAAPPLNDTDDLRKAITDIASLAKALDQLGQHARIVSRLPIPVEPTNPQPLADSIEKIDAATHAESENRDNVQRLNREIEQFQREIEKWVTQNPRCMACGQAISAELITAGGHAHE